MADVQRQLRALLAGKEILLAPGAYDGMGAKLIEKAGFPVVYATGGGIARSMGFPDLGLLSFTEVLHRVKEIVRATTLPVIADADTGYGSAVNVIRTVREFEDAGVAALHIEDQIFPKRCGHYEGHSLISSEEMAGKIEAAASARKEPATVIIARTDARSVYGLEEAISRARLFLRAGADAIFIEAPGNLAEIETIVKEIKAPLVYNMTESGKSPMLPVAKLAALGFKIVLFPSDLQRAFIGAGKRVLAARLDGDVGSLEGMSSFKERDELVGLETYLELEKRYVR
ncbi:MAG: isocitrate lyase [Deltaproteobacteria bacterium GWA2_57_13]|nr:MAG: isocitrate lyase [Deltaproteobacteria bacterium GWA2_57_13]OGQ74600.1 MAG: isocitrate lyase [Deltaproteobacteria bacterium RIFCSPLOWO2_12_FULL_57_22]